MKTKLLFLVGLVLCGFSTLRSQNLLTNAGFENWTSGRPTAWTVTNATYIAENTTLFNEGTKSIRVDNSNSSAQFNFYQNLAVVGGKTYTFRVSYYVERGDGSDARIICYFKNKLGKAIPMSLEDSLALKGPGGNLGNFTSNVGQWTTYTYDVVAPADASTFVFYVRTNGWTVVNWDNFYFAENNTPTLYCNTSALTSFSYTEANGGPSAQQSFTVKGNNIATSLNLTVSSDYELSLLSGAAFAGANSLDINAVNNRVATTTVYVRLKSGKTQNTYNGTISMSATGAQTQTISLSGFVGNLPVVINTSTSLINTFSYPETTGPSAIKSFTVSGSGLVSSIVVTAPANFEISALSGTSFVGSSSFTIAQTGGNVPTSTLYVRLKAGLAKGTYSGDIVLSTTGASKRISLMGTVSLVPGITLSTNSLPSFNYTQGNGPSDEQSVLVSGASLTSYLVITSPTDFEISTETGPLFSASNQILLSPVSGNVTETPIYIRLKAGLAINTYTENLNVSSVGFSTKTLALTGNVSIFTANEAFNNNDVKVIIQDNKINVMGVAANQNLFLYNVAGVLIDTAKSTGDRVTFTVTKGAVYFVKTATKCIKVII